jgi:RecA/RadA recombinase
MLSLYTVGAQARLMSQALRKIAGNASKCNCTIIFLNQLRHKVHSALSLLLHPSRLSDAISAMPLFTCSLLISM